MGGFPLVGRPALEDLLGEAGKDKVGLWFSVVMAGFLVGAATGGVLLAAVIVDALARRQRLAAGRV